MAQPTVTDPTVTPTPPSAGVVTEENWQERVAKLEEENKSLLREKQGIYADAKEERRKRQELEAKLNTPTPSAVDEETLKAKKFVQEAAAELVAPLQMELDRTKALNWLAKQESKRTGKTVFAEDIETSPLVADLARIEQEKGLRGMGMVRSAQTAYELLLKEGHDKAEAAKVSEAARLAAIENNTTENPRTTPPTTGKHKWTRSEIRGIDVNAPDYEARMADAKAAIAEGRYDRNK